MNNKQNATITKRLLSLLTVLCLTVSLLPAANAAESRSEALLRSMTTEEKVSQMLMPAFRYWNDAEGNRQGLAELPDDVAAVLERHGFAGVVLFAQNTAGNEGTVRLADAMQTANAKGADRTQLLIAIDQEGGSVTRLGQGTAFPGNMALGAVNDLTATQTAARTIGEELRALGVNFDFAPVLDVNNNPANPVIGTRSFSDDANIAAKHGAAFMRALMASGTISTLKHFPGHGDTGTDSHTGLPRIDKTYDQLKANELIPFRTCIDAGAEAIMTAHIQYPAIEKGTYVSKESGERISLPATLSKTILTDILRGDLGFDGVILTDAMDMDAISKNFEAMDAARLAITAGVDILLMPVDPGTLASKEGLDKLEQYIADLTALVNNGTIPMARVDESVARILALKEKHGLLDGYDGAKTDAASVGSVAHHAKEWEIAKRAVTLVKNDNDLLPLNGKGQKIAVLTAYDNEVLSMEYAVNRLKDEKKLPDGTEVTVTSIQKKSLEECLPLIEGVNHVIAVSEAGSLAAMNPGAERGAYSALLDALIGQTHKNGGTFTVLSASLPYDAARYTAADAFVITWNARGMSEDPRVTDGAVKQYGASMPAALYQMLSPDAVFTGKLPVNIPTMDENYQYTSSVLYARGFGLPGKTAGIPGDVKKTDWFYDAAVYAAGRGLIALRADNTFAPHADVTRGDAACSLWVLAGKPAPSGSASFTDAAEQAWDPDAIRWADEQGILTAENGAFGASEPISRQAFIAALYAFARNQGRDVSAGEKTGLAAYGDAAAVSEENVPAMQWACGAGIVNGTSASALSPDAVMSRAQAAAMLMRWSLV